MNCWSDNIFNLSVSKKLFHKKIIGVDYPIWGSIPSSSFSCEVSAGISAVDGGYYADQDTDCQVSSR